MTSYAVHYMRPEWFCDGTFGKRPDPGNLAATHVLLKTVEIEDGIAIEKALEGLFHYFQGEVWSPNGEARELIEGLGLRHTSMSAGDAVVDPAGRTWVVAPRGFDLVARPRR